MENHHHVDKISQLPQPILHRILSLLSQNDAVKTCVLSKSWRYLWLSRPNLEFRQTDFPRSNRTTFMSTLETALQRCHDQDLTIQDFFLEMYGFDNDSNSAQLLIKLISNVLHIKGLKTFRLHFLVFSKRASRPFFQELPPILLKSESLRELHLQGCKLTIISNATLQNLHTLSLARVLVSKPTLEILFSSCPLLENVSLLSCEGFETISNNFFPNLKSVTLTIVRLSNESFDLFSAIRMPSLKCLTLDSCYGFEEVDLRLSDSVEHLTIRNPRGRNFTKAAIDAPNIVKFVYEAGKINLNSGPISFTTSSVGWESHISVRFNDNFNNNPSSWFGKVNEQLGALSGSRISLELVRVRQIEEEAYGRRNRLRGFIDRNDQRDYHEPVEVENLSLRGCHTHSSLADFLFCMFRICRPRYVGQDLFSIDGERNDKELTLLLFVILIMEREMREHSFGQGVWKM